MDSITKKELSLSQMKDLKLNDEKFISFSFEILDKNDTNIKIFNFIKMVGSTSTQELCYCFDISEAYILSYLSTVNDEILNYNQQVIMHKDFKSHIIQALNNYIDLNGWTTIAEISNEFKISVSLANICLNSINNHHIRRIGTMIVSSKYMQMLECYIKGICLPLQEPITLDKLSHISSPSIGLKSNDNLLKIALLSLMERKELRGSFLDGQKGNWKYTPNDHRITLFNNLIETYNLTGYLSISSIRSNGNSDLILKGGELNKSKVLEIFPGCMVLQSCICHSDVRIKIKDELLAFVAIAEEILNNTTIDDDDDDGDNDNKDEGMSSSVSWTMDTIVFDIKPPIASHPLTTLDCLLMIESITDAPIQVIQYNDNDSDDINNSNSNNNNNNNDDEPKSLLVISNAFLLYLKYQLKNYALQKCRKSCTRELEEYKKRIFSRHKKAVRSKNKNDAGDDKYIDKSLNIEDFAVEYASKQCSNTSKLIYRIVPALEDEDQIINWINQNLNPTEIYKQTCLNYISTHVNDSSVLQEKRERLFNTNFNTTLCYCRGLAALDGHKFGLPKDPIPNIVPSKATQDLHAFMISKHANILYQIVTIDHLLADQTPPLQGDENKWTQESLQKCMSIHAARAVLKYRDLVYNFKSVSSDNHENNGSDVNIFNVLSYLVQVGANDMQFVARRMEKKAEKQLTERLTSSIGEAISISSNQSQWYLIRLSFMIVFELWTATIVELPIEIMNSDSFIGIINLLRKIPQTKKNKKNKADNTFSDKMSRSLDLMEILSRKYSHSDDGKTDGDNKGQNETTKGIERQLLDLVLDNFL